MTKSRITKQGTPSLLDVHSIAAQEAFRGQIRKGTGTRQGPWKATDNLLEDALQRSCRRCHQPPGLECRDDQGNVIKPHKERKKSAATSSGSGKSRLKYAPIKTTFVCPECEGPHSRQDCDRTIQTAGIAATTSLTSGRRVEVQVAELWLEKSPVRPLAR
jgi:hypothetical protein